MWHIKFGQERHILHNWVFNRAAAIASANAREMLRIKQQHRHEMQTKEGDLAVLMNDVVELEEKLSGAEEALAAARAELGARVVL